MVSVMQADVRWDYTSNRAYSVPMTNDINQIYYWQLYLYISDMRWNMINNGSSCASRKKAIFEYLKALNDSTAKRLLEDMNKLEK